MTTYKIIRFYQDARVKRRVMATGLTLEEAQAHCQDPETSSRTATKRYRVNVGPWFDGYEEE